MRYDIYKSNGTLLTQTADIEYSGEWMGARKVTLSIKSAIPESLTVGCYVVYRGARYELNVDPTVQKSAKVRTTGEGFLYENIQFDSITNDLVTCGFLDYVEYDNQLSFVSNPKFSFHADDVTDLVERIQANLDRLYTGTGKWTIEVDESYSPEKKYTNLPVSVDNINCWEALKLAYDTFDCKFVVDKSERKITIATSGDTLSVFKLGKNEGLTKIIKSSEANQQIISRLRAYGNSKNMPLHYYYYKAMQVQIGLSGKETGDGRKIPMNKWFVLDGFSSWLMFTTEITSNTAGTAYRTLYYTIKNESGETVYTTPSNGASCYYTVTTANDVTTGKIYIYASESIITAQDPAKLTVVFDSKCVNKNKVPTPYKHFTLDNPARLLSAQNVMLPGFPATTYDPYLSMRESELGIREATKFFDGSDDEVDDIYPTIEDITFKNLRDAGYSIPTKYADNSYINTLLRNSDTIADDGVFGEGVAVTPEDFKIYLKDIGFNVIHDETIKISGTQPKISFTTGDLKGRDFEIDECEYDNTNKGYILTCKRVMDESLKCYYPNKNYNAKAEDTFVLSEIYLPDMYVEAASARLETAATAYLAENNATSFKYEVEIDPVYMARHTSDFHDKIKEGDLFWLDDDNLGIDNLLIEIANLTISEKEGKIPTYKVTLDDEKEAGTLQKIQNAIKGISNGTTVVNGGGGGSLSRSQIIQLADIEIDSKLIPFREEFEAYNDEKYLRKDQDDSTTHDLGVKNLTASGNVSGANLSATGSVSAGGNVSANGSLSGASATISGKTKTTTLESTNGSELLGTTKFSPSVEDGKSGGAITHPKNDNDTKLQVEYLHVLKKATFESIEVNHVEHIAGNLIMSPAKATLYDVVNMDDCYRCYFLASDGDGNTINNTWKVNDQAYCCTFDATALSNANENGASTDTKVGNRYYWRLVKAVSSQTVTRNGKSCHYIDLWNVSDTNKVDSNSDVPWAGDYVVLRGNRTDTSRQGTIELNTTGAESNLPSFCIYNGINSFTMPTSKIDMNPHNVKMLVDELKIVTGGENKTIQKYIEEDTEHFNIFETESTAVPTLTNEPYISWTDAERTKYSTSPNNAVVLNADGRTWKFLYNSTTKVYYFEEFTDPWLLSQHQRVSDILDDKCITADEIPEMKKLYSEAMEFELQMDSDYSSFTSPSQRLYDAKEAVEDAMVNYVSDFLSHREDATPIYFSDYTGTKEAGHTTLDITRDNAIGYAVDYSTAVAEWNSALASEKQSKVGEAAAEEAKEYITEHINDIISSTSKNAIEAIVKEYGDGNYGSKSTVESNSTSINAVTTWIGADGLATQAGMETYLSSLFVGTKAITFDANGKVENISTSGLVTDTNFASLFTQQVGSNGTIITSANVSTYIDNGISHATIYADKVSITSGKSAKMSDYWSIDSNGNAILKDIYARDITVSGVLLNLITEIKAGDSRLIRHGDYDDIDILRCGDVIKIKSANGKQLRLPYYISSSYNNRTYTKFNSTEAHLITPDELKTILGKRITLIIENSLPVEQTIDGVKWLHKPNSSDLLTDTSNEVNNLMFGERVFLLPTEDSQAGNMGLYQGIYNLEFKACLFKDGSGNLHNGFAWLLKNDARTCGIDTDENWGYVAPTTDES